MDGGKCTCSLWAPLLITSRPFASAVADPRTPDGSGGADSGCAPRGIPSCTPSNTWAARKRAAIGEKEGRAPLHALCSLTEVGLQRPGRAGATNAAAAARLARALRSACEISKLVDHNRVPLARLKPVKRGVDERSARCGDDGQA